MCSLGILLLCAVILAPLNAQTAYFAGAVAPVSGEFNYPEGVALDSSGNIYVADTYGNSVLELTNCTNGTVNCTVTTLGANFHDPSGVAVDKNGNVYVADGAVYQMPPGCISSSCETSLGGGLQGAEGVAVDASGNVYVAVSGLYDSQPNCTGTGCLYEMPPNCAASTCVTPLGGGFHEPYAVAVDNSNNIYVADYYVSSGASSVYKMTPGCTSSACVTTLGGGFYQPTGVTADASGNVYVADSGNGVVKEIPSGCTSSTCVTALAGGFDGGFSEPWGIAVDNKGDIFASDYDLNEVKELMLRGVTFAADPVGSRSSYLTFYFTFTAGGSGISPSVVTQGATGLDFTDYHNSGTCDTNGTSHTYNPGDSCSVSVVFVPQYAGPRYGAVTLSDATKAIATVYVYATGQGPQLVFPGNQTIQTLGGGFVSTQGVAVNASGNIYVTSGNYTSNSLLQQMPAGCASSGCVTTLGGGFDAPFGVAVDGSGNVYVADEFSNEVKEVPPGCLFSSCVTTLGGGFSYPSGVAVDGSGNVYIGDQGNNAVKQMPPGCASASCVTTIGGGFSAPVGVAVDGNRNVYVADDGHSVVKVMPPDCLSASCVTTMGGGFYYPAGVAVDASGNVYVGDDNNAVKEMPAGCASAACVTTLGGGFSYPIGVALDGSGNVYVADQINKAVKEIDLATPPTLTFAASTVGAQSPDSPQTVLLRNIGNVPLTFPAPTTGENPSLSANFTLDAATTCPELAAMSSDGTLAAGATCELAVDFIPTTFGPITGSLVLTDNNLNATSATQTVPLSGTGLFSIWIVDGTGGTSELNGSGADVTSSADPGKNLAVAIDYLADVWTIGSGTPPLEETSDRGALLNQIAANFGGLDAPTAIAIDGASQIWIANGNNTLSLFANSGTPLSPSGGFADPSLSSPAGIAVDLAGSVWITNKAGNSLTRILGAAVPVAPIATSAANNTTGGKP